MAGKGMYRMSRKIWIFSCSESGAERRDLTRRLIVGAILTAPVVFAMMAHEFFDPPWLPSILLNHWLQLALITPVMFYTG